MQNRTPRRHGTGAWTRSLEVHYGLQKSAASDSFQRRANRLHGDADMGYRKSVPRPPRRRAIACHIARLLCIRRRTHGSTQNEVPLTERPRFSASSYRRRRGMRQNNDAREGDLSHIRNVLRGHSTSDAIQQICSTLQRQNGAYIEWIQTCRLIEDSLSVCMFSVRSVCPVRLSLYLFVYLFVRLSIDLFVGVSIRLPVCLSSVSLPISVCLYLCFSVSLIQDM